MNKPALLALALAAFSLHGAPALADERVLATIGGWRVILNRNNDNSFNRCIIETNQNGQVLRVAHNGKGSDYSLSVPALGHRNGDDATIGFNDEQPEYFRFASDRQRAWTSMSWDMSQLFETARTIEVWIGNRELKWNLRDAQKAIIRLTDCVNENAQ
ncbi:MULTISPECIES: hypothetical protein [unclassified Ancylobacter]|uniref:hypothetical protein n=1 Tax=unclassified Ancylobacter TaxID=2626613 RepID=UPI0022706877|nr:MULTISPECIES: hypothetical protein [unclassified Ancylobacter]WAC26071.1 hypothetical protein OU996_13715 [Ancylobacter sp. SL191]WGD30993.1 hypothetical protein AncyloWKF20_03935 [Ancylobacter sp. WKF20]